MFKLSISIFLYIIIIFTSDYSYSQLTKATIGVDGFTCSLCAKGVEEQFKALDYVKSVKADLKKTEFIISFKNKPDVDVTELIKAVTDGGFTLRDITVEAKGKIKSNGSSGYILSALNIPDIKLKNIDNSFDEGDNVSLKGSVSPKDYSISVTSIKKQ
ncbi:MAG: heavy-metal-associated domain-containing protein [Ignavibacteria bacterium]|nr:heavy-metal-associated domain-containing protein [Ignavibacteria bacterium]